MKKMHLKRYSLAFLIPGLVIYFVIYIVPTLSGIYYSFFNWDLFSAEFCGFQNYINILTNPRLSISIKNTFIFATLSSILKAAFGIFLAVMLNMKLRSRNFLRTVFYVPSILNNVAVSIAFIAILHPSRGMLNTSLNAIGLDFLALKWLTDTKLAIYTVSFIESWKWAGFSMLIVLGGLQSIDHSYYEAADIDGASGWKKFIHITFPMAMPAINNAVVLNIIGGLKIFDMIYVTTKGGPGRATTVLSIVIYEAFSNFRMGEASAGSIVLSFIVALFAITIYTNIRKKEVEL
jgi:raffinose/stachyose/melibiose transport system permease protein